MTVIAIALAQLTGKSGTPIKVHFNPVSLQYTVANTLSQQGGGKKQYVSQSTAKLTMDLVFDTTETGTDVRIATSQIAKLMEPGGKEGDTKRAVPDVVNFEWGSFSFKGMVESYKETLDFFAPEGVPLRASVNLTLSKQDKVFEPDPKMGTQTHEPAVRSLGADQDAGRAATDGNAEWPARAAKEIGALNNLSSLRESAGTIALSASVSLSGPVAFASGGLSLGGGGSLGIGAGAGAGASASFGASASGGASFGASASAGASFGVSASAGASMSASVGGSASAGVTASAGAFAGLRSTSDVRAGAPLNLDVGALTSRATPGVSATGAALFSVGGQAEAQGSTGATIDVGGSASLRNLLQFEG